MATTALINAAPGKIPSSQLDEILRQIRSSSFVAEALSGEEPPEDSDYMDAVLPLSEPPLPAKDVADATDFSSTVKALRTAPAPAPSVPARGPITWGTAALVLADSLTAENGILLVVQLDEAGHVQDRLRIVPRSVIEVVGRLFLPYFFFSHTHAHIYICIQVHIYSCVWAHLCMPLLLTSNISVFRPMHGSSSTQLTFCHTWRHAMAQVINLQQHNLSLAEYKAMAGPVEYFDAGQ